MNKDLVHYVCGRVLRVLYNKEKHCFYEHLKGPSMDTEKNLWGISGFCKEFIESVKTTS